MITNRMKQIVKLMRDSSAHIQEHRDAYLEKSTYSISWKSPDGRYVAVDIKEQTLDKLEAAGLVKLTENNPVYNKSREFVTSQGVWELVEVVPPKEGAPIGNKNAVKPPETHRRNVTFKLSPEVITRLKTYKGNKSRLVETLLKDYFEAMDNL